MIWCVGEKMPLEKTCRRRSSREAVFMDSCSSRAARGEAVMDAARGEAVMDATVRNEARERRKRAGIDIVRRYFF